MGNTLELAGGFTLQDIERIYNCLDYSLTRMDYTEWHSSLGWVCDEDGMRSDFTQFWQGLSEDKRAYVVGALGLCQSAIEDRNPQTNDITAALKFILDEINIKTLRDEWCAAAEQHRPICSELTNQVYDLLEEYGQDNDLPENWWLDEMGDVDEAIGMCIDLYDDTNQYKYEINAVCPKYNESHTTDDAEEVLDILVNALNDGCKSISIKRNGETILLKEC